MIEDPQWRKYEKLSNLANATFLGAAATGALAFLGGYVAAEGSQTVQPLVTGSLVGLGALFVGSIAYTALSTLADNHIDPIVITKNKAKNIQIKANILSALSVIAAGYGVFNGITVHDNLSFVFAGANLALLGILQGGARVIRRKAV